MSHRFGDPARHQINLNISPGDRLAVVPQMIKLKKIEPTTALPSPKKLMDVVSGTQNGTQTLRVATFVTSRPGELVFVLPATMPSGEYTLEVRGEINNNMRVGRLAETLQVA